MITGLFARAHAWRAERNLAAARTHTMLAEHHKNQLARILAGRDCAPSIRFPRAHRAALGYAALVVMSLAVWLATKL